MTTDRRQRVAEAFSAACDYDSCAVVQHEVAQQLAMRIAGLRLPRFPRVLEIGCGTGHLTEALLDEDIGGDWLITDLSLQMIERCRSRMGKREWVRYAVLDGERPQPHYAGQFDLICSNLAVQWFEKFEESLSHILSWLAPGGHCVFTTLGPETFAEWRKAHEREGLEAGTPEMLSAARLARIVPHAQANAPVVEYYRHSYGTAVAFLKSLKAIGAGTPGRRHRPLSPLQLKRVMRQFERSGATATYEVVTCHYRHPGTR